MKTKNWKYISELMLDLSNHHYTCTKHTHVHGMGVRRGGQCGAFAPPPGKYKINKIT